MADERVAVAVPVEPADDQDTGMGKYGQIPILKE